MIGVRYRKVKLKEGQSNQSITKEPITILDSPEIKGKSFEQFIVKKFAQSFFTIKEWRGDKSIDGIYPESNLYPDLEVDFSYAGVSAKFAVECKFRSSFNEGSIEIAYQEQLNRYKEYHWKTKNPVYIALGVGGTAIMPKHLYLIPLNKLKKNKLSIKELEDSFWKNPHSNFYFDRFTKTLS